MSLSNKKKLCRIKYWFQDTDESGRWALTGMMSVESANLIFEKLANEHKQPTIVEAEEYEN